MGGWIGVRKNASGMHNIASDSVRKNADEMHDLII